MIKTLDQCQIVMGTQTSEENPLSDHEFAATVEMRRLLLPDNKRRLEETLPETSGGEFGTKSKRIGPFCYSASCRAAGIIPALLSSGSS